MVKIRQLPITQIDKVHDLDTTKVYISRMNACEEQIYPFNLLLAVEKTDGGRYILVGGFDKYEYMLQSKNRKYVPCIIEPTSKNEEQLNKKILLRLCNNGDSTTENRLKPLTVLQQYPGNISFFKKLGLNMDDYFYHKDIPTKYRNPKAPKSTLNWIAKSNFEPEIKNLLYNKAILPQGNKERLTQEKVNLIKGLLSEIEPKFNLLTIDYKKKILERIMNIKGLQTKIIKEEIEKYVDSYAKKVSITLINNCKFNHI